MSLYNCTWVETTTCDESLHEPMFTFCRASIYTISRNLGIPTLLGLFSSHCITVQGMKSHTENSLVCITHSIINPPRACAARFTVVGLCVCLSVCLFVDDYSRTTGYEAAYERYQQLQCYKGMIYNVAILLKRLRSRDIA